MAVAEAKTYIDAIQCNKKCNELLIFLNYTSDQRILALLTAFLIWQKAAKVMHIKKSAVNLPKWNEEWNICQVS